MRAYEGKTYRVTQNQRRQVVVIDKETGKAIAWTGWVDDDRAWAYARLLVQDTERHNGNQSART